MRVGKKAVWTVRCHFCCRVTLQCGSPSYFSQKLALIVVQSVVQPSPLTQASFYTSNSFEQEPKVTMRGMMDVPVYMNSLGEKYYFMPFTEATLESNVRASTALSASA
eukprot:1661586-Amphidinium_carterae.1